jgi:hypothetical protein
MTIQIEQDSTLTTNEDDSQPRAVDSVAFGQ